MHLGFILRVCRVQLLTIWFPTRGSCWSVHQDQCLSPGTRRIPSHSEATFPDSGSTLSSTGAAGKSGVVKMPWGHSTNRQVICIPVVSAAAPPPGAFRTEHVPAAWSHLLKPSLRSRLTVLSFTRTFDPLCFLSHRNLSKSWSAVSLFQCLKNVVSFIFL